MFGLIRFAPIAGVIAGAVALFVLWQANGRLEAENALLGRSLEAMKMQAAQSRLAAVVARAEAKRASSKAAELEQIKDAFRTGDFNAPLPDDFRLLLNRILQPSNPPR